jgi:Peptidase family S41/N-terminal domain of Peptidase_S41 in eukaryotic IRBP
VERAEQAMVERVINHEMQERFSAGAVQRAVLLQHGDDPAIEPGQLLVRVFVEASDEPGQSAHQGGIDAIRRELSLRLPAARLLEFTIDSPGDQPGAPRISVPDDGSLAAEQLSGREIVTKALELLRANYVFPEQAGQAATTIEARLEAGEYDDLDEITLTERLTRDLQEITGDRHLRVVLGGGPGPHRQRIGEPEEPKDHEARRLAMRRMGRHNGGGAPEGVVFWCSYLLDERPTHLNDIFHADTGETRQFWALPYVPGTRYPDRPVFVLTSGHTFSGGEDFAYTLQALGRATVVGETTGGGAHPTRGFPISAAVHIGIPFARSVNPVTGTNWQGTGVVPDMPADAERAYDVAYARALEKVLAMDDVPPPIADEAREALAGLQAAG